MTATNLVFEANNQFLRKFVLAAIVLVWIKSPRVIGVIKNPEVGNSTFELIMILVAVVIHFEPVNSLGKYREGIVLRVNADDLDLVNLHLDRHQNGDIIKAGCPLGAFVKTEDTNSALAASSAFSDIP
jgi:hypothetical protein